MRSTKSKLLASITVIGVLAAAMSAVVFSAFSDTTDNPGNTFSTADIDLADNDSGTALFTVSDAAGGATYERCIRVTYTGAVDSTVRMYGTTGGDGLDQYLTVDIDRSDTGEAANCSDFDEDSVGAVYDGTLAAFPDDYATGTATDGTWANAKAVTYRIRVTVGNDEAAQGKNATQTFTWEARSS